jgi:dTDP-4-dehydrorhamnose reductase
MNNKVLLLGASGYIGETFRKKLPEGSFIQMKYSDLSVQNLLNSWAFNHFDTIINCTGYIGENKDKIIHGNLHAPIAITEFVNIVKELTVLHISSCDMYKNYSSKTFTENSKPNNCWSNPSSINFHAASKALAEEVISRYPNHYICRAGFLFDQFDHPKNYLSRLISFDRILNIDNSLSNRQEFVEACIHLIKTKASFGTYNIVNTGHVENDIICKLISKYLKKDFKFYDCVTDYLFSKKQENFDHVPSKVSNDKILATGAKMSQTYKSIEQSLERWN